MNLNNQKMTNHPPSPDWVGNRSVKRMIVCPKHCNMGVARMKADKDTEESKQRTVNMDELQCAWNRGDIMAE